MNSSIRFVFKDNHSSSSVVLLSGSDPVRRAGGLLRQEHREDQGLRRHGAGRIYRMRGLIGCGKEVVYERQVFR